MNDDNNIFTFEDLAKELQEEENQKRVLNNNEKKSEKIDKKENLVTEKKQLSKSIKKDKSKATTKSKKNDKEKKELNTEKKENFRKKTKEIKTKRFIRKLSKKLNKTLNSELRYTEPKDRNILSRLLLQRKLEKGEFEYIKENCKNGYITPEIIEESKEAKRHKDRKLYKEVQKYEDAKDDVTARKGWKAFKIGLATSLLAGCLAVSSVAITNVKNVFDNLEIGNLFIENIKLEDNNKKEYFATAETMNFKNEIRDKDGYRFNYLSNSEFAEGYYKMLEQEKKMKEHSFNHSFYEMSDQELLNKIVKNSFKDTYDTFSEEQKRDYIQLAYELLPHALSNIYKEKIYSFIRNPIVIDSLNARNSAISKGYTISLVVNNSEEETVKNIGNLIYLINDYKQKEFENVNFKNDGQDFLKELLNSSIGETQYSKLPSKNKRDYLQIAYELLPQNIKENYVVDPIELEMSR